MARPRGAKSRAAQVVDRLKSAYPDARCALDHSNAYELLVATILSAQCTDERVNMVTPSVFAKYPTPGDLAHADPGELEELIRSTGFFRSKAKSLVGMAQAVEERYGGEIPTQLDDFVTLPGVGRKTTACVLLFAYGMRDIPVDTHVGRVGTRLGLFRPGAGSDELHDEILAFTPRGAELELHVNLLRHGRRTCHARAPRCGECALRRMCPRIGVTTVAA